MNIFQGKVILLLLVVPAKAVAFEQTDTLPGQYSRITDINPHKFQRGDTVWIISGICKPLKRVMYTGEAAHPFLTKNPANTSLLKIHGNVQYDFTYRSFVDTPFSQKNFQQHTVQTTLDITLKEQYPLRMTILHRSSNSAYFEDITDVNIQFNQGLFLNQLKSGLTQQLPGTIDKSRLTDWERRYLYKKAEIEALQNWINSPGRLQEMIEEKENQLSARLLAQGRVFTDSQGVNIPQGIPSLPPIPDQQFLRKKVFATLQDRLQNYQDSVKAKADSLLAEKQSKADSLLDNSKLSEIKRKKQELEKALIELKSYEGKLQAIKKSFEDSVNLLKQKLAGIKDPSALKHFIQDLKLKASDLPKGWQTLAAIQTIGIGRTWVDYSDLTVKNISLTGINAELNPSKFYFAFAAGRVNYQFRDFIVKNSERPTQNLYLIRAGVGRKESNHFIFTWYDGKRNMLNSFSNTAVTGRPERVIGMSAQVRLQLDPNNYLVLESAKSSFHHTGTVNQPTEGLIAKVWNFNDRSNEAYSIKLYSNWPKTSTKVTGYYRKMGEHFQSFNLQPVNAGQVAYQLKMQQLFWKRRLQVEAGVRKNDFNSPFINPGLTSKTVFKSAQLTLRVPKYPYISVGYYPSSQLTLLDNNVLVENQYNTLSAVAGHSYRAGKVNMSSNAVLLKFYNSGADSGFIYYNATSVTVNQFIFLKGLQLQTGFTKTMQRDLIVTTLEQSANYQFRKWLTVSAGIKYNRVNQDETLWGGTAGLGLVINKIGTIQASYDKSYLPGTARNLLPVDMGRITYYRVF